MSNLTTILATNSNNNNNLIPSISSTSIPFNRTFQSYNPSKPLISSNQSTSIASTSNQNQNQQQQQQQEHQQQQQQQRVSTQTPSEFIFRTATMEDSMIPRRRRRTTDEELNILEIEFKLNPLPSQEERRKIAEKVLMSGRACQVWFQNRRQKEKKDPNTSLGSELSSNESAPDQDQDSRDLEPFTFSSSPTIIPSVFSNPTTNSFDRSSIPFPPVFNNPLTTPATKSLRPTLPNESLISKEVNKENISSPPISPDSAVLLPLINAMVDQQRSTINKSAPIQKSSSFVKQDQNTFVHRAAKTSNILAKKHVSKRQVGGRAPLARTSILSHNFEFPASPPKKSRTLEDATNNVMSNKKLSSLSRKASVGGGLFSLLPKDNDRAKDWVESLKKEVLIGSSEEVVKTSSINSSIQFKNAEMWRHMESDPPSELSPPNSPSSTRRILSTSTLLLSPLSRKRKLESSENIISSLPSTSTTSSTIFSRSLSSSTITTLPSSSSTKIRGSIMRSHSLGGISLSQQLKTSTNPLENSRAGEDESCAEVALSRKRARMIPITSIPSVPSSSKLNRSRSKSYSHLSQSSLEPNRRRSTGSSNKLISSTGINTFTPPQSLFPKSFQHSNPLKRSSSIATSSPSLNTFTSSSLHSMPLFPTLVKSNSFSHPLSKNLASLINNLPSSAPSSDNEDNGVESRKKREDEEEGEEEEEGNSSLGELSFTSSTCTSTSITSSVDLSTGAGISSQEDGRGIGKINLMNQVMSLIKVGTSSGLGTTITSGGEGVGGKKKVRGESEEERECAELLLGLGGFNH